MFTISYKEDGALWRADVVTYPQLERILQLLRYDRISELKVTNKEQTVIVFYTKHFGREFFMNEVRTQFDRG